MRAASWTEFPSPVRDVRRFQYPRPVSWPSGRTRAGTPALLRWFTRNGEPSPALDAPAKYFGFSLSPDGRRLAFSRVGSNGGPDLWVRNLDGGGETQLTFDGAGYTPQWSPDGSQILFTGIVERPPPMLFIKDATRPGGARPLDAGPGPQFASSWSGHDLLSVIVGMGSSGGDELMVQRVEGGRPEPLALDTAANESEGSLSSNGKWIAYTTDQTGRDEVWVASFPSGQLRRQVSLDGGISPRWCERRERDRVPCERQTSDHRAVSRLRRAYRPG